MQVQTPFYVVKRTAVPEQGSNMQVQTPFYVIKRTAVTREAAMELFNVLRHNDDPESTNASDLIDFCLSGPKEEKVFLSLGDRVRLKKNAGWRRMFPTSGEAALVAVTLEGGLPVLKFDHRDDDNYVCPDNMDLSAYVELI